MSSGSSFAMLRASAALNAAGACTERSGGVDFYRWLCALEREFDARADACIAALQRLSEKLFVTARLRLSVTGGTEDERQTVLRVLREALPAGQAPGPAHPAPLLPIRREGIVIPSEVSFAAVCGDVHAYSGALRIACRAASLGHYWNEIRVQGGAYGTGLLLRDTGLATAYTYRDPDCARSRGAIGRTAAYLAAAASEPQEANIIGAISDAEPLLAAPAGRCGRYLAAQGHDAGRPLPPAPRDARYLAGAACRLRRADRPGAGRRRCLRPRPAHAARGLRRSRRAGTVTGFLAEKHKKGLAFSDRLC